MSKVGIRPLIRIQNTSDRGIITGVKAVLGKSGSGFRISSSFGSRALMTKKL
jgi:hypothetical protein